MPHTSKRPEDMIPDDKSHVEMGGHTIRKGTIAAALANAEIIASLDATAAEKKAAMDTIKELASALKAAGLTKFLTWKNPDIQAIFDQDKHQR